MAITSVTPYVTEAEADVILSPVEPWDSTPIPERDTALINAKLYMDATYSCRIIDSDNPDQSLKDANALLANEDLTLSVFGRQDGLGPVKSNAVKAGSVESKKEYATSERYNTFVDPFPSISAMIGGICSINKGNMKTITLIRR